MKHESATETYLRRATRGLWGRRRREVREELETHLSERVLVHQIAGLAEADAVERALSELGRPQEVSMGMARLYTLPTVIGSSAFVAAASVAAIALFSGTAAQSLPVPSSFYWPSAECTAALRSDSIIKPFQLCEVLDNSLWLDPQALTQTLKAQGVGVRGGDKTLILTFPGVLPIRVPVGELNAPIITVDGTNVPIAPGSLSLWTLVEEVTEQTDLPLRFEGWDNPVIHIGETSFQVGTDVRPISGADFYDNYLEAVFFGSLIEPIEEAMRIFLLNPRTDVGAPLQEAKLKLTATMPGVYGVITRLDPATLEDFLPSDAGRSDLYVSFEVAQLSGGDTLTVELPEKTVRFAETFGSEPAAGAAVLVRLNGSSEKDGWYEVVSPEEFTLEPTPKPE